MKLLQLIREDWETNHRDWSRPGFQALAVYRFGVWRMGVRPRWLRAPFSLIYKFLFVFMRNIYGIELPFTSRIGRRFCIEHQGGIVVHGNATIGDDCTVHQGLTIGSRTGDSSLGVPSLGNGIYIGASASILGRISIGDRATIAAGAVVIRDVPANALVGGVPAKVLGGAEHP